MCMAHTVSCDLLYGGFISRLKMFVNFTNLLLSVTIFPAHMLRSQAFTAENEAFLTKSFHKKL